MSQYSIYHEQKVIAKLTLSDWQATCTPVSPVTWKAVLQLALLPETGKFVSRTDNRI